MKQEKLFFFAPCHGQLLLNNVIINVGLVGHVLWFLINFFFQISEINGQWVQET